MRVLDRWKAEAGQEGGGKKLEALRARSGAPLPAQTWAVAAADENVERREPNRCRDRRGAGG